MNYTNIYMVGIGGIGMSALAQLLKYQGKTVTGSDREESPTTQLLKTRDIQVSIGHLDKLPEGVEAVIYSDAIPSDNKERASAKELNIPQFSYFEALGEISKGKFTITISGAHGKTTTTAMLGKLLTEAGKDPTVVVGSIIKDFNSNFRAGDSDLFVVEGCEYMDHLLKLDTNILVITNIEHDHPDYFKDLAHVQHTFKRAIDQLPKDGIIVTNPSDINIAPILEGVTQTIIDYTKEDISGSNLTGFNEMNGKAAVAGARAYDSLLTDFELIDSLGSFQGAWRRFDYIGKASSGADVYDDYAHHPTEVRKTLEIIKELSYQHVVVAFHPHLISRTKAFFSDFVDALSLADNIIIAPIYKARAEKEEEGVTSEALVQALKEKGKDAEHLETFDEIAQALEKKTKESDVIITMGAGDIYKVADMLVKK